MKTTAVISSILVAFVLPLKAQTKADVEKTISAGVESLKSKQNADGGYWVTDQEPALSALVLMALQRDPSAKASSTESEVLAKGYAYLLKNVQPDGGIYAKARANYNTSISLTALLLRGKPEDEAVTRKAVAYLAGAQNDFDVKGKADNPADGGFGYGGDSRSGAHADLSNTTFALEALKLAEQKFADTGKPLQANERPNWEAALKFLERCQKPTGSGADSGSFSYTPLTPSADGKKKDGRQPMRTYGSISYAGMLSFIYAGLKTDDPRVTNALQWLGENYTVDENPGMGAEGLFYFYHTMAKAMSASGLAEVKTKNRSADWRSDLSKKLISLQSADGSWVNDKSGRWMESDPVLVTSYSVLALEHLWAGMK